MAKKNSPLTPKQQADTKRQNTLMASAKTKLQNGQKLTAAETAAVENEYGALARLISTQPELRSLFSNALVRGYADSSKGMQRFTAELRRTNWYKTNDESNRAYATFAADPGNAADLARMKSDISRAVRAAAASDLGIKASDPKYAAKIAEAEQNLLQNHFNNWQNNVSAVLAEEFADVKALEFGGKVGTAVTSITSYYREMGLPLDPASLNNYTSQMLNNDITLETIQQNVRKNAASMWVQFADRINAGETLNNILYPYKQMMASVLEIDPETVDITKDGNGIDPVLQKALFSASDPKSVMNLTDFRKALKQDSRWQYTRNAQEEYAGLTTQLMRMFGAGV